MSTISKGVILAGGQGTRLRPATQVINKHLIPIMNVPMICYPLATLKRMGVIEVFIVSGGENIGGFTEFLGSGSQFGMDITYGVQDEALGIANALSRAESFVSKTEMFAVILGDNVFEGTPPSPQGSEYYSGRCSLYTSQVEDNRRFGVPVWEDGKLIKIVEKPQENISDGKAIVGLYVYPTSVFEVISDLSVSDRGEYEITDVNNYYVKHDLCDVHDFKGFWTDAGTPESLVAATEFASSQEINPYDYLKS